MKDKKSILKSKMTIGGFLGYFFSFIGLITILSNFISGLMLILVGFILIPKMSGIIENKLKIKLNKKTKIVLSIIFLLASIGSAGVGEEKNNSGNTVNSDNNPKKIVEDIKDEVIDTENNTTTSEILDEEISDNQEGDTSASNQEEKTNEVVETVEGEYYLVTRVIDGDTIEININETTETIRLVGIDTPETKDPRKPVQCFGQEAYNKTNELLLNRYVRLKKDSNSSDRGKYGRLIRYVYRDDGLFFNKWMIENGYAYEYTYDVDYQYQQEFEQAQQYAENNQLGLWNPNTCNGNTELDNSNEEDTEQTQAQTEQTGHTWYTSSHHTAQYYYCDTDLDWQELSERYLKQFNSEEELLNNYDRILHEPCQ